MTTTLNIQKPVASPVVKELAQLEGAEHNYWRRNHAALTKQSVYKRWTGCAGFGFIPEVINNVVEIDGIRRNHLFADNKELFVASLVTLPLNRYYGVNADARLVTVSRPKFRAGAVVLDSVDPVFTADFSLCPFDKLEDYDRGLYPFNHLAEANFGENWPQQVTAGRLTHRNTLNHVKSPGLFSVFNRLQRSVLSFARKYSVDFNRGKEEMRHGYLNFGEDGHGELKYPKQHSWMPIPYVSTKLPVRELLAMNRDTKLYNEFDPVLCSEFVNAVAIGLPIRSPVSGTYLGRVKMPRTSEWSNEFSRNIEHHCILAPDRTEHIIKVLRTAIIHRSPGDAVRKNDEIGFAISEPTPYWYNLPNWVQKFSNLAYQWIPEVLRFHMENWLEGQTVRVNGEPVLPYHLVALAATRQPAAFDLRYWDFGTHTDCFNSTTDSWIMPPIRMRYWDDFHQELAWNVALDLTPKDLRVSLPYTADFMRQALCR